METDRLYQVLPIMRELKKERREEVEQFFQDAPDWLLDSFRVVELDKNVVFIRENQPVDTVHIIVRGMFKITDYRVYGIAYDFMQFDGINAMGGIELLIQIMSHDLGFLLQRTDICAKPPCIDIVRNADRRTQI